MRHRWIGAWLLQIGEMALVCLAQALSYRVSGGLYALGLWVGVPLAGLLTAFGAVKRGLINYAAWIAPPACLFGMHYLIWRYSPSAGAGLLTALTSLIGAAAGEVWVQRNRPRKKNKRQRS